MRTILIGLTTVLLTLLTVAIILFARIRGDRDEDVLQGGGEIEEWTSPVSGIRFVKVKRGGFIMGSDESPEEDQRPSRRVRITNDFWIGIHEVSQREYECIMGFNFSRFRGDSLPVEQVSWDDAERFCDLLTELEREAGSLMLGFVYRLPTEAEWEYAARGGHMATDTKFAGSDMIDEVSWYEMNSLERTHPVGSKAPNELGLYDMSGNVSEWCLDKYYPNYSGLSSRNPLRRYSSYKVILLINVVRGGSWGYPENNCRVSFRDYGGINFRYDNIGFRVVLAKPIDY